MPSYKSALLRAAQTCCFHSSRLQMALSSLVVEVAMLYVWGPECFWEFCSYCFERSVHLEKAIATASIFVDFQT